MTVQELMDVSPWCDLVEIVVRQMGRGKWIQGYRIGKEVRLYPVDLVKEVRELKGLNSFEHKALYLEDGEDISYHRPGLGKGLPMRVICRDCHKLPEAIGNLEICSIIPRNVPRLHGEPLTDNNHSFEIDCYPDNFVKEVYIENKADKIDDQIQGQMSLEDMMGGTE